jgi:hypothetical protein
VYLREENTGPDRERTCPVKEPVLLQEKKGGGREDKQEGKQGIGGRAKAQDIEKDGWQS